MEAELGLRLRGLSEEDLADVTEPELVDSSSTGGLVEEKELNRRRKLSKEKSCRQLHLVTW